jgi:hypothetical protein
MRGTKLTRSLALLILFTLLSVASIVAIYFTHQFSTEDTKTETLCTYVHRGIYDYTAKLKPNNLYNQTTLKPDEGTLYIPIIDHIDITFFYELQCSRQTNTSLEYHVTMDLESPGKWVKVFTASEMQQMFQLSNTVNSNGGASTTFSVGPNEIKELVNLIDKETGTSSSSAFNLNVKPEIYTVAKTDVGTINEVFDPTLAMEFTYAASEGNYISMEELQQTSPGAIQRIEKVFLQSIMNQRLVAIAMAATSFVGLAFSIGFFIINKTAEIKPQIKPIEKIIAPHKEIIIDVAGEPSYKGQEVTVPMNSLEDLIKLADGLDKPVFHLKKRVKDTSEKPTRVFYVLDGLTRYEYEAKAS